MNPLDFGGCKEGQTSVTKTKEEGMCDGCKKKMNDEVDAWKAAAMGAL